MSEPAAPKLELSRQQSGIVEQGPGHQVIVAGAGTGKTETLTRRVLHLLTAGEHPAPLHHVLALTFTDKAAGEMRQRIYRSILARLNDETDPQMRARLDKLRAEFVESNRIGTFDAFNHRLLALYPERVQEQSNLAPGAEPMNDYERRDLKAALSRAFWAHAETLEGAPRAALFDLLGHFERHTLLALLDRMAGEETSVLHQLARDIDEAALAGELHQLALVAAGRATRRAQRALSAAWDRYEIALPSAALDDVPPDVRAVLLDPEQLRLSLKSDVLTKETRLTAKVRKVCPPAVCDLLEERALPALRQWRELGQKLEETLDGLALSEETLRWDAQSRRIVARLARFGLWWQQARRELCRERRWADFPDMQRAALRLLEDSDIAARLRAGSRHILIDEFQDTNIEQWRLIERFRDTDNVLIVGDGKQAIYRFRGGDITVFDEVRQTLLGEMLPAQLSVSRRSTPPIVEFCNRLFRELLPAPNDPAREAFEAPFQPLEPGRAASPDSDVRFIEADAPIELGERDAKTRAQTAERELLADAVALLLKQIQDDADAAPGAPAQRPEFAAISQGIRGDKAGTVGILFRTHARKTEWETALRRRGVRYATVKGAGFFQSEQVRDALNLAHFLFDCDDSLALTGLLRSPLAGVSDQALLELRIAGGDAALWPALRALLAAPGALEKAVSDDDDRLALRQGCALLQAWHEQAAVRPLSDILETVARESNLAFYDALHPDAVQRAENWRKVVETVREREGKGQGSLREIALFLASQEDEEEREPAAALPDSGAIQLMTIFAAKGLGFPLVIVGQMDDVPAHETQVLKRGTFPTREDVHFCVQVKDEGGTLRDPFLWTLLKEEDRAQQEAEFRRLLYVACTRAGEHLLLAMPRFFKPGSWADHVAPFVAGKTMIRHADLLQSISGAALDSAPPAAALDFDAALLQPLPLDAPPFEIAVTELLEAPNWRPTAAHRERREWGRAVHQLLALNAEDRQRCAPNLIAGRGLPQSCLAPILRQVASAHRWLGEQGFDLARAEHEVPFSLPAAEVAHLLDNAQRANAQRAPQWINGVIDLLLPLAAPEADGWALVDFKTRSGPPHGATAWRHEQQLKIYVEAAAALGLNVRQCWLLFLDEDGALEAVPLAM